MTKRCNQINVPQQKKKKRKKSLAKNQSGKHHERKFHGTTFGRLLNLLAKSALIEWVASRSWPGKISTSFLAAQHLMQRNFGFLHGKKKKQQKQYQQQRQQQTRVKRSRKYLLLSKNRSLAVMPMPRNAWWAAPKPLKE